MVGSTLWSFVVATLSVVAFLYLVYLYIKCNPQIANTLKAPTPGRRRGLQIESSLSLEPRKNLYVVRDGHQRFLLATSVDKTEFLATLESRPAGDFSDDLAEDGMAGMNLDLAGGLAQSGTERFMTSLKMVFNERFSGRGGR